MFSVVMPSRVRGRVRGPPVGHVRGCARGRAGTGGRGVEASSSSSTPGDVFGGVPRGAQYFRELAEAMWEFTQAAWAAQNEILPPPPATLVVNESVVVPATPVARMEPRALSIMKEFEKRHPPTFFGDPDPVEAELWLKRIVFIFEHIGLVEDHLRIDVATFQFSGRAQIWWDLVLMTNALDGMTWGTFKRLFLGKYFLHHARNAKRVEFLSLQQGDLSIANFEARFGDLARFAPNITSNNATN